MHLLLLANHYIHTHLILTYLILLAAIILEGEVALIVTGIFAHIGVFTLPGAILLAIAGALIKTFGGYGIGKAIKLYIPKNKIFDFIEKRVLVVFPHFSQKPFWSLFFSKFIYGLNHFTIIFAGYIGAKWRTYLTAELISGAVWITIMLSIGYFFSVAAFDFSHDITRVLLYILMGIIGFLLIERIVGFIIEFVESEE